MFNSRIVRFALLATVLSVANVEAQVVSYFNFDTDTTKVNSQLTPTVVGTPTTVSGKYSEGIDFNSSSEWNFTGSQLESFLGSLNKTCTISFWAKVKSDTYGSGNAMNAFWLTNQSSDSNNARNMFTHFAYSNGTLCFFDSGNNGYDRIYKGTTAATDYPVGEWVHWTYVKNASSNTMQVYRNGVLWMSGNGSRSISGITKMYLGHEISLQMDDFTVYGNALSSGEILNLATSKTALVSDRMNRSLSNSTMEISPGGIGTTGTMRFVQQQNLAYGRGAKASQSTEAWGGSPSRAVDGNTSGAWGDSSIIHTDDQYGNWWQVQFADSATSVDKITIWNRTDSGCTDRLGNFTMTFYTGDPSTSTPVYTYKYSGTFPSTGTIDLPEGIEANWVRITNGVAKALNIAEVQVYTTADNGGFSASSNNGATIDGKQYQSYNLSLSGNSVLTMDIDYSSESKYDKLSVSGALTMGGTLKFNCIDASGITVDAVNDMIQANSYSGKFDKIVFTGDDVASFDSKDITIRIFDNNDVKAYSMVHWKVQPTDTDFSNLENWSSDPSGKEVAVGLYGDEAKGLTLDKALSVGYFHLAYSTVAGETSVTIQDGGSLSTTGASIGENNSASMTVEDGGSFTSTGDVYVGHGSGTGTLTINGGTVSTKDLYIACNDGTTGYLNVNGGTLSATKLRPGYGNSSTGVVNITDGVVTIANESEIGNNGSGKITVSGNGKLTFNSHVRIANAGKATSYINIEDNGEVEVQGYLFVGQRGTQLGSMTLSDNAKLTVGAALQIGTDSGSKGSGTMTLTDNASVNVIGTTGSYIGFNGNACTLNVADNASFTIQNGAFVDIGDTTTGTINQTGGTITLSPTGIIYCANNGGGVANLNISGGQFNTNASLWLSVRGTTTINLSGTGEINTNKTVYLSEGHDYSTRAYINQTGGTFNANAGIQYGNYTNGTTGIYNLSAGTLNATSLTRVGNKVNAQLNLSGTGTANIGTLAVPVNMTGGTLSATKIDTSATTTNNTFQQSGGTLAPGGVNQIGTTTITGKYVAATLLDTTTNIAKTGTAYLDSTLGSFYASNGNNGNYSDFAHSLETAGDHYWGVSYGTDVNFGKLVYYNRQGWGSSRIADVNGFHVEVLDGSNNVVWKSQDFYGGYYDGFEVYVPYNVVGQKIQVVRHANGSNTMQIQPAEVEVYSYATTSGNPTIQLEMRSNSEYDQLVIQGTDIDSFDIGDKMVTLDLTSLVMGDDILGLVGEYKFFDLPDGVEITGEFAEIKLPDLLPSMFWDLSKLYTEGKISIGVPEPSTWALLILGTLGLMWRLRSEKQESVNGGYKTK